LAMGNLSSSVSGFGAGEASRKSLRGSTRSFQRQRASSSCCHYNNWLVGDLGEPYRSKVAHQERGLISRNDSPRVVSPPTLEELLNDCIDFDVVNDCVSPCTEAGSSESSGEGSGYFSDDYQFVPSLRDDADDDQDEGGDDVMVMCEEDKAMMMIRRPTTICGEEWINWTAFCPCCRRDASDDSIDLQEMIKLEAIRVSTTPLFHVQCTYCICTYTVLPVTQAVCGVGSYRIDPLRFLVGRSNTSINQVLVS